MKSYLPLVVVLFLLVSSCSKDEKPVQYELSTSINPAQSGSISPSNGAFNSGQNIRLTATATTGYVFKNWSGDVSSSVNPLNLILDTNKNIIAVFEKPDNDNDGVPEADDQCPDTPSGEVVDENGCSETQKDTDGDGVNDDVDECPDTVEGEIVNTTGCTTNSNEGGGIAVEDADDDGISDDDDQCPETPEGETVNEQGCSNSQNDTDGDGVNDDSDNCPDTPEGETADGQGCSESQKDTDGDGVNNNVDQCAETPSGEIADEQGCSESQKDTDNDGVNDDSDDCPETPDGVTVDVNGCVLILTTFVPDDVFEQRLINIGIDDIMDDQVLTANMTAVEDLNLGGDDETITDMTGFEAFTSISSLDISGVNDPTFILDTADYPSLSTIFADRFSINSLIVDSNSNMETIIGSIGLETLSVINNNSLTQIDLEDSTINSVNLTSNTQLEFFTILDGNLGDVVITDNAVFNRFGVTVNEVRSLNLSNNSALEIFVMEVGNEVNYPLDFSTSPLVRIIDIGFIVNGDGLQYTSLDISENTLLESLSIEGSGLTTLDVSNNPNLIELDAVNNGSLLTCIKVNQDQLDAIPSDWFKDAESSYALDCGE